MEDSFKIVTEKIIYTIVNQFSISAATSRNANSSVLGQHDYTLCRAKSAQDQTD